MKKWIYLSSVIMLLFCNCTGCRHNLELNGRVLSNVSGEPIRNAQVTLMSKDTTVITDSLGFFNLSLYGSGKMPRPIFTISKEGYKDFKIEFDQTGESRVYTVTRGTKDYNFGGKRFYPDSTNLSTFIGLISFEKYSRDFTTRNDTLTFYMDIDDDEIDLQNYLKEIQNSEGSTDKYKIQ